MPRIAATEFVRRALLRHIERSLDASRSGPAASDEAIHTARKELKRARAALRLLRAGLGTAAFRPENAALRAAARPLAAVRDSKVLVERCDELARRAGIAPPPDFLRILALEQTRARRALLARTRAIDKRHAALAALARRAARWPIAQLDPAVIGKGIARTYRRGRRAFDASRAERSVPALHEWRRQAQYLWHELEVLEPLASGRLRAAARAAHRVAELLGEDHDLALLHARIAAEAHAPRGAARRRSRAYDAFLRAIEERRARLEERALQAGERLYGQRPRAFARRIVARCERGRQRPR